MRYDFSCSKSVWFFKFFLLNGFNFSICPHDSWHFHYPVASIQAMSTDKPPLWVVTTEIEHVRPYSLEQGDLKTAPHSYAQKTRQTSVFFIAINLRGLHPPDIHLESSPLNGRSWNIFGNQTISVHFLLRVVLLMEVHSSSRRSMQFFRHRSVVPWRAVFVSRQLSLFNPCATACRLAHWSLCTVFA